MGSWWEPVLWAQGLRYFGHWLAQAKTISSCSFSSQSCRSSHLLYKQKNRRTICQKLVHFLLLQNSLYWEFLKQSFERAKRLFKIFFTSWHFSLLKVCFGSAMCIYLNISALFFFCCCCSLYSHLSVWMYWTEWILQQTWRVHVSRWQFNSERLKCHLVIET